MRGRSRAGALVLALAVCAVAGAWATRAAAEPGATRPGKATKEAKSDAQDKQVDLNSADEKELSGLPGVGPALAKRIVEFRDKQGPFRRVEDLMKVRGIGEKSFEKLRPRLRVGKPR